MNKQHYSAAKTILLALTLIGMMAIPAISSRAQSLADVSGASLPATAIFQLQDQALLERRIQKLELLERHRRENDFREKQSQGLEGSWAITATPVVPPGVPQPPSFRGHATIARGGAYFGSDRTRPFSKQHGSWDHIGGNEFVWTFTEDLFDVLGNLAGTIKVRARVTVLGVNEFVGVANGEQQDLAGNVLFNRCVTLRAERIMIEPLAPQCQNIVVPQ